MYVLWLQTIMNEMVPFIISGVHVVQRDQPLSALNTFVEALARCNPPLVIKPFVLPIPFILALIIIIGNKQVTS